MPKKMIEPAAFLEEDTMGSRPKRSPVIAGAIVVVLLGLGAFLGAKVIGAPSGDSPYSAVYLTTGDVYFGTLKWFPKPRIERPLYLDRGSAQVALVSFRDVFWGPGDSIYLNPQEIVFSAPIRSDSPLVAILENPELLKASPPPATTSTTP